MSFLLGVMLLLNKQGFERKIVREDSYIIAAIVCSVIGFLKSMKFHGQSGRAFVGVQ